jgi:hypothetical protein
MAMGGAKSVLCFAPGWKLHRTKIDAMHCVNLGISHLTIGNTLWFSGAAAEPFPNFVRVCVCGGGGANCGGVQLPMGLLTSGSILLSTRRRYPYPPGGRSNPGGWGSGNVTHPFGFGYPVSVCLLPYVLRRMHI